MFFHFGYADYILFESWVPYNGATFLMGCIFCFLMGFFYETSLYYARQLERNWLPSFGPPPRQQDVYLGVANNSPNQASPEPLLPRSHSHDISDDQRFARDDATFAISNAAKLQGWTPLKVRTTSAVMRFVLIAFAYLCMLIIMTYNIWLCVFVVMGMAMGVFVWPHSSIPQKEHCC